MAKIVFPPTRTSFLSLLLAKDKDMSVVLTVPPMTHADNDAMRFSTLSLRVTVFSPRCRTSPTEYFWGLGYGNFKVPLRRENLPYGLL